MPTVRISKSLDGYLTLLAQKTGHTKQWHTENALDEYICAFEVAIESGTDGVLVVEYQTKRRDW